MGGREGGREGKRERAGGWVGGGWGMRLNVPCATNGGTGPAKCRCSDTSLDDLEAPGEPPQYHEFHPQPSIMNSISNSTSWGGIGNGGGSVEVAENSRQMQSKVRALWA